MILLFGVLWPVFSISGRVSPHLVRAFSTSFFLFASFFLFGSVARLRFDLWLDLVGHMLMPALAPAIPLAAYPRELLDAIPAPDPQNAWFA